MTLKQIQEWQQLARPNATEKHTSLALGIFLEEVGELLEEFTQVTFAEAPDEATLPSAAADLKKLATRLKANQTLVVLTKDSRKNTVKELADVIVTAVGLGQVLKLEVPAACERVNLSNYSKFVDGQPLYDANGKVVKGPNYKEANLDGCY